MTKLEEYNQAHNIKSKLFLECLRSYNDFQIGPTNKGGMFIKYKNKDIMGSSVSIEQLKGMRDAINDFLKNVAGVE